MRDIKTIKIEDEEYPEKLRIINDPPKKLYAMGNIELLQKNSIAIIGSRNCTKKGEDISKKFAEQLSKYNLCIISGMAKGIDSFAHTATLEAGGKTIAVMGTGFNYIYPEENKVLFKQIIKSGGLVITEYEENMGIESQRFVQRNRIVSALSIGVLVIEAKYRSGTTTTASFAKSYGKKVFCIAHDMEDKSGVGTNFLIKKGAILVTEINDIIKEFPSLKLSYKDR